MLYNVVFVSAVQQSESVTLAVPTLLAPGTGFVEDNFSMDGSVGDGSGGNASDGE